MPHSKGKWQIRREDAEEAIELHNIKKEAVNAGKKIAKEKEPSRLVIHKENGIIELNYTYG
jgi:hypothetical protein